MKSSQLRRRDFLKAGAIGMAASQFPLSSYANVVGANNQVRLAIIGLNGRGREHYRYFSSVKETKIAALCDVDSAVLGKYHDEFSKSLGYSPDTHADYREILDRDDIDAVAIATPNHWHAKMTVDACRASKAAYAEKPVCHNLVEGREMLQAVSETGTTAAAGFQNRSDPAIIEAITAIQAGEFGEIKQVRGCCYRERRGIGKSATKVAPPKTLDYDRWLGPAEDQAIYRPNYHYDWHWDYNTGNGDMGNQGPHELDMMRWVLGDPTHPVAVRSTGGRFVWNDAGNTYNMQFAEFDFGNDIPAIFEVRNMVSGENYDVGGFRGGPGVGITVTCENGVIHIWRSGAKYFDNDGNVIRKAAPSSGDKHYGNFIESVRENDPSKNNSSLESAYYSSCLSHLANASARVGKPTGPEAVAESVADSPLLSEIAERYHKQLTASGADFKQNPWQLGEKLGFDPAAERFTTGATAEAANGLLGREARKAYAF